MRNHLSPLVRNRPLPERSSSLTRLIKPVSSRLSRVEKLNPSSNQFLMSSNISQIPELDFKKESSSLFKENKRLKAENTRLQENLSIMQEELQSRDVFTQVLSNIDNERYDTRRLALYRAKTFKQERMIELLTTALESQKGLYFEMDTLIKSVLGISKRMEKAEENLMSITYLVSEAKKKLKEVEKNIKIAYSQLVSSNTDSPPLYNTEIDISQKLTIKLDVKLILEVLFKQTEEALNDILIDLQDDSRTLQQEKIRIAAQKLLALGMKLPMGRVPDSDQLLNIDEKRVLNSESNKNTQRIIKSLLDRVYHSRNSMQIEIANFSKEAYQNKKAYKALKRTISRTMSSNLLMSQV